MANNRHTFGLEDTYDFLWKLERELERVKGATFDRDDLVDHAFNFAVTAWHLTDWTWRDICERPVRHTHFPFIPVPKKGTGLGAFQEWAKSECKELDYCQAICNESKHASAKLYADQLSEATRVSSVSSSAPAVGASEVFRYRIGWTLKIVLRSGDVIRAVDAFELVEAFWTTFCSEHGLTTRRADLSR